MYRRVRACWVTTASGCGNNCTHCGPIGVASRQARVVPRDNHDSATRPPEGPLWSAAPVLVGGRLYVRGMVLIPASQPACWSAVDAGALEDQQLVSGLREIVVAENALSSLKLRVLAQIETRGLARQLGSKTTGDWFGGTGTINPGTAKRMVRTALGLKALPTVAEAVRGGDISFGHAAAVVTAMAAIDAVARDLDESVRAGAVRTLLAVAAGACAVSGGRQGPRPGVAVPTPRDRHSRRGRVSVTRWNSRGPGRAGSGWSGTWTR